MASARKNIYDPYRDLIGQFNEAGVDYVVVGMSGINYYAQSALDTFGTQDYDIFLRPDGSNAEKALKILRKLGYETVSSEGPLLKKDLKDLVRRKKTLLAANPDGVTVELLFEVSGFVFQQLSRDASVFSAGGTPIRVAKLHKLLASKKAAGRPKDRLFLKRYEMILKKVGRKGDNASGAQGGK